MLYRTVPKTGDKLSILGFGCMRLPEKNGRIDEERAIKQVRSCIDKGVNYIDTAWPYHSGESEPFVGRVLADGYRDKVKIATKLPSWMVQTHDDMDLYLNAQLEKLQTDQIDYYLLHNLAGYMWAHLVNLGVCEFLDRAKRDGRIANAGFSFHGTYEDFKRIVDGYPWEFCQIQYNYLDEENQAGTKGLEYAASKNLGIIVMEPLRGGNLGSPEMPKSVSDIWDEAQVKRSPAQWALQWVWNHPEVTVVLSGMNNETHIDENLKVAEKAHPGGLSERELQLFSRVAAKYRELMKVGCTGCGYCKPCPSGVNIPLCFEVYNKLHMFGNREEAKFSYAVRMSGLLTGEGTAYASQCTHCEECLDKCPQYIEIPDFLEKISEELEGPDLKDRELMVKKMLKL